MKPTISILLFKRSSLWPMKIKARSTKIGVLPTTIQAPDENQSFAENDPRSVVEYRSFVDKLRPPLPSIFIYHVLSPSNFLCPNLGSFLFKIKEEEPLDDVPRSHKLYLELKTDIAELKANQVIVNDKLDRLLKMMDEIKAHRQPTGSESEATQSDVLPEGYQPDEDIVIWTPTKEHTPKEQQTLGVKELQLAEVATVKFGRKKRVGQRSKRLLDYTDPSNKKFKINDLCKPNPFWKIENKQLDTFRRWLAGLIDNRKPIQLPTGAATTGFFFHLQTPWKWLSDEHIDVAFRLIRERLWLFPKTYRKKVALANTVYIACMNGRWDAFRKASNKAKFLWDDQVTDYAKGDANNFQRGREEVDEVYYPLNIGSNHWVLVQIDLPMHILTVYDSDQALYDDARVEEAMRPMMKMLPYFLLNVERVADRSDLDLTTMKKPHDFDVRRLPPNVVPQTMKK
ncbi:Ulp1 protease family, C-terminal catalytic domain containing protein [Parasponia andersonii]|uniref:Ulp1 protease family, C-terminal catalytic domain containing protein n=1 Tax=Parasponia andersonii TaxID=3476 RepID=A0A2P5B7C3_PARAD|nr:Ulp1 protease family, C-terminal catalytic domain containing protein [Parasponia andersonii]